MVWYELQLGNKHRIKYTPVSIPENSYPDVDSDGTPLKKVAGSYTKGYWLNEKTGEKVEKSFKLINGQVSSGWTGRIKEVSEDEMIYVNQDEVEDLITEHTFLVESPRLFEELKEKGQAIIFAGWFGNGYKVYKCYIYPSKLYDGFCIMSCGRGQLSEQISRIVGELTEYRELKDKLAQVELNAKKVNNIKASDMIKLK